METSIIIKEGKKEKVLKKKLKLYYNYTFSITCILFFITYSVDGRSLVETRNEPTSPFIGDIQNESNP